MSLPTWTKLIPAVGLAAYVLWKGGIIARLLCRLLGHNTSGSPYTCAVDETGARWWHCTRCGERSSVHGGRLVRVVTPAEMLPRGFGVAWIRWQDGDAVCMPVPLNLVAGTARRAWFWLKAPRFLYQDPRAAYFLGRRHGYEQAVKDSNQ